MHHNQHTNKIRCIIEFFIVIEITPVKGYSNPIITKYKNKKKRDISFQKIVRNLESKDLNGEIDELAFFL